MPVTQISSVSTDFKLLFKDFLIGIIVAINRHCPFRN